MSERDLHERASALFLELRDLSADDRTRRLDAATTDPTLRAEVVSLLENDCADSGSGDAGTTSTGAARVEQRVPLEDAPARIGPYHVIERIGHGGSGFVLLAEQHEPVRRRVAIKIVPHAAISPDFAARFEFERRALERTDHPNIARILDAGRTADGLPYLVMDYVEGVSITAHCRRQALGLRDRIFLMLDVADAVQHAHQRGVIHRDLKPGNILISDSSGRATPRVLDFGIAKPIPESFDVTSPVTSGMPLGTPAYMAPEQTGGQLIDTRADVYGLGAILYELTCGRPPIETTGDPMVMLGRIRDAVPPPASRIREQHAQEFGADLVQRPLLHDLDCILARALEKEPFRRYATVAALAEDLRRLLRGDPIEARPATLRYRAARFAQRNRVLVGAVALVAAAVIIGVGGLTTGLIEANRQRREAINQNDAQREIIRFLTEDLLAASSPYQQGESVTALDLLHRASRKVDERFPGRPLTAAALHYTLGTSFMELGAFNDAAKHLNRSVEIRRGFIGADAPDTVRSEIALAALLTQRQQPEEAEAAFQRVMPRARQILGPNDPVLYSALNDWGTNYLTMDKGQEALTTLTEALEGRKRLLGARDPQVLVTTANLAQAHDHLGQTQQALEIELEALKIADSLDEPPRMTVLGLCNNIGATYLDLNRDVEAAPYVRRSAELAEKCLGPDNPATLIIRGNLAGLETELGDPVRGAELYDDVVRSRTRVLGPDASDTLTARYGYWNALWHAKRFDEAAAGLAELLEDIVRALGEEHGLAIQTRVMLARTLYNGGRPLEALPYAHRAAEKLLAMHGPQHAKTRTAATLRDNINQEIRSSTNKSEAKHR